MKSWISFLIPDDEYKEKKMLYFFSEGGIFLFLFLIAMIISNKYFNISVEIVLLCSIAIFLFYVFGRYIMSGIEYTDISTEKAYIKELRVIFIRTVTFVFIFMSVYMTFIKIPNNSNEWLEILGFLLSVSIVMFFSSFISLKCSYKKNKELL
ncbi:MULTISPECIES: DUF3278 domain-containing protein [Bacillus]|uniref:DUF3278 domain-containing protein n=1 Tax=Bacillus TaxID=1386 RepID=UPI000DC3C0A4|nr:MULTISPECIES: DUF3278 domain-containing protein [Bacillus]MED1287535.1 DUF3278 domain-containing protein [Bacillus mycoides]RAN66849.1 hypothetical protein B5P40_28560 [Bacillus sp. SRB_8]WJE67353.1 DUF3278 domain-containing protein [Bacillus mycoides]WJE73639.1 DUF3278 domain-containing protein [Bacillus mycoides]